MPRFAFDASNKYKKQMYRRVFFYNQHFFNWNLLISVTCDDNLILLGRNPYQHSNRNSRSENANSLCYSTMARKYGQQPMPCYTIPHTISVFF